MLRRAKQTKRQIIESLNRRVLKEDEFSANVDWSGVKDLVGGLKIDGKKITTFKSTIDNSGGKKIGTLTMPKGRYKVDDIVEIVINGPGGFELDGVETKPSMGAKAKNLTGELQRRADESQFQIVFSVNQKFIEVMGNKFHKTKQVAVIIKGNVDGGTVYFLLEFPEGSTIVKPKSQDSEGSYGGKLKQAAQLAKQKREKEDEKKGGVENVLSTLGLD